MLNTFVIRRRAGVNTLKFNGNTYDLNSLDKPTRLIVMASFRKHCERVLS